MRKKLLLILALAAATATLAGGLLLLQPQQPPTEMPTHASGTITTLNDLAGTVEINEFHTSENVYAKGAGMSPNLDYEIYIIEDTTITLGMSIPSNVTPTTIVTTDSDGAFGPTLIWSAPITPGDYDIIADLLYYPDGPPGEGTYDVYDAIDDNEIHITAGFFVIPEVPLGTIAVLLASFAALGFKRKRIF